MDIDHTKIFSRLQDFPKINGQLKVTLTTQTAVVDVMVENTPEP